MEIRAEEVHKHATEAIRNWDIAFQKENEKNKWLQEELHYEKLAKEALPIHMNEKILKIISILRGVKKDHNMGHYPDELIHCRCEAMHNICWDPNVIATEFMQCKMKNPAKWGLP